MVTGGKIKGQLRDSVGCGVVMQGNWWILHNDYFKSQTFMHTIGAESILDSDSQGERAFVSCMDASNNFAAKFH